VIEVLDLDSEYLQTTDGDIAVTNLQSALRRSWGRFAQYPLQAGTAEAIVEQEQLVAQFVGDLAALDRLEALMTQLTQVDPGSARTALIQAQVASVTHRFAEAKHCLAEAELHGAPAAAVSRLSLNIDQACGADLAMVLDARREIARESARLEDLVPLGALLADLCEFADADRTYRQALLLSARGALGRART